jgi:ABC-2 type transport system permease protein
MIAAFRTELVKQVLRLRTFVVLAIVVLIPVIMTIANKANPPGGGDRGGGPGEGLRRLTQETGLIMPAFALRLMSVFLLVIVVALFAGDAVAGDASWGNLRYLLVRPVKRARVIASKLAVSVLLSWVAILVVVVVALIAGVIAFGSGALNLGFGFTQSRGELLAHLGIATVYVAWTLTGVLAFSFMVSTMTDSPAGAIAAGVGLYFLSQILDAITALGSIRYGLPTHYFDSWVDMFTHNHVSSDLARGAFLQLGYILLFCGIAAWWFRRKDVLS